MKFKGTIGGVGRKLQLVKLTDSQAISVGDAIETYSTGYGILATIQLPILGVVASFCDSKGMPKKQDNPVAGTASGVDVTSIASTSNDYALVDISSSSVYSAALDATVGTTNALGVNPGCKYDGLSATPGILDESSYSRTVGTVSQWYSWGLDPNDSTRVLVSIALSEIDSVYE